MMLLKLNKEGPFKKEVFRAPGHQASMKKLIHFLQQVIQKIFKIFKKYFIIKNVVFKIFHRFNFITLDKACRPTVGFIKNATI